MHVSDGSRESSEVERLLAHPRMSDAALAMFPHWVPPVPAWKPIKKPNSSLRIAAIVSDRLYQGLRFEGELMLLTPENWRQVLRYGRPDLLIVESTWETATGHWHLAQSAPTAEANELSELVGRFRAAGVPSAYWITKDQAYHAHYKDFARKFEHIFCADTIEMERLRLEGIASEYLPPCVQPALYNPFREFTHYDGLSLDVLFDGWADIDRNVDDYQILTEIEEEFGLDIIESRYSQSARRLTEIQDEIRAKVLGCVSRSSRATSLKYAFAYLSFGRSLSTEVTAQWMALEATASYLPVVHRGRISELDIRKGLVTEVANDFELLQQLRIFKDNDISRRRRAHCAWRATMDKHTFSHRVRSMCERLHVTHDWIEYPKVSLVTPTYRSEMLVRCMRTYECQAYPNKEFVLVFNGVAKPELEDLGVHADRVDVKIAHVPREFFTAACLNFGYAIADGAYCFKADDDDFYGDNYILDMILCYRSVDADVCGKPTSPFVFEGDSKVYIRSRGNVRSFMVGSGRELSQQSFWIPGNSLGGPASTFVKSRFSPGSVSAADTIFNLNSNSEYRVMVTDEFNLVAERRNDVSSHTWRINAVDLKSGAKILNDVSELNV